MLRLPLVHENTFLFLFLLLAPPTLDSSISCTQPFTRFYHFLGHWSLFIWITVNFDMLPPDFRSTKSLRSSSDVQKYLGNQNTSTKQCQNHLFQASWFVCLSLFSLHIMNRKTAPQRKNEKSSICSNPRSKWAVSKRITCLHEEKEEISRGFTGYEGVFEWGSLVFSL